MRKGIYTKEYTQKRPKDIVPLLMIHGVAHTGECFEHTPDGRLGWALDLYYGGRNVIVLDWPGVGRSKKLPFDKINGMFLVESFAELIQDIPSKVDILAHSMAGPYAWKLAELLPKKIRHIIGIAPGEMGNIQKIIHARTGNIIEVPMPWGKIKLDMDNYQENDHEFVHKKLIGSSRCFPRQSVDSYLRSLQLRHPQLTFERLNINGSQLTIEPDNLREVRVTVITGTHDVDHTREIDGRIVEYLKQNGVDSHLVWLGDRGIDGNGHMMMLESNSSRIAELIDDILSGKDDTSACK